MDNLSVPDFREQSPLQLGMLLYPHMTLLDLAGPQATLGFHSITHLISNSLAPVLTDSGVSIVPTATYQTCPEDLDVLFVPGGFGTNLALQQEELLNFLARAGKRARFITSVCSGSVLLAAAGLLDGYRAATHWAVYKQLETFPNVTGVHERVVIDRNRFTGGGVTAGIDFGLTLLAALRGEETARMTQLMMEYDPQPPFNTGTPALAGPELTAMAEAAMRVSLDEGLTIARALTAERIQPLPAL